MKYIQYRPTWAEINLANIAYNLKQIKKLLKPGTKVAACVKADAYGHGLIPVSKKLVSCGVDYLGVASIEEGVALRKNRISVPVLILGSLNPSGLSPVFKFRLTPAVATMDLAVRLNKQAHALGRVLNIHIKVDTGMGRLGVLLADAERFIKHVAKLGSLRIEGVFTHFPCADCDRKFTLKQIKNFKSLIRRLRSQGYNIPLIHTANSMGIIGYRDSRFNMVRPGLALYGLYPKKGLKIKLKPALSLKTRVIYLKQIPARCGISYGRTYITKKPSNILTLPIGYGDGYPRSLSNIAPVLIRGKRYKISGTVCMDQAMVDAGAAGILIGEEAVLIGKQAKASISAEELAKLCGTISYEIVCGLGSRIPRVYKK